MPQGVTVKNTEAETIPVHIKSKGNEPNVVQVENKGGPLEVKVVGKVEIDSRSPIKVQQEGTWNVGISGTPTVNIGTMPTLPVQVGPVPLPAFIHVCVGSALNGERALSASEHSALRAGIFKA